MRTINLNKQEGCKVLLFPDKQPHVTLTGELDDNTVVICSITDSQKLLELCMLTDVLNNFQTYKVLHIPYLLGARYDRMMEVNGSFDLKVIAKIINSLNYDGVVLYDVHSDVSTALIDKAVNLDNKFVVDRYRGNDAVLIIPDAGAAKKAANYANWNDRITNTVHCVKHRDLSTGNISLQVLDGERCKGRNCVIIDDICDGGRTFINIAKEIKEFEPATLSLMVTHGIFSNGFEELEKWFDAIVTTNSLPQYPHLSTKLKVISIYDEENNRKPYNTSISR